MKARFLELVRLLSVLCLAVWAAAPRASAQTPLALSIQVNAGHAQLSVTGAVGTVCQIQWTDNLSNTNRWFHLNHCVLSNSPAFLTDSNVASAAARYYRAVWTPSTNLVWIPPGTFTMGSPASEVDRYPDEGPQTMVTISRGFWMGKYLVTQGDYLTVVGNNPSFFQGDPTLPVEQVSWNDATNYCALATAQESASGRIPTNCVYRLATEAEWEYACRAGTTTRFYYGDDLGYTNLGNSAWYVENSGMTTRSVGQKLPNAWGLYDMAGNVFEWCQDWYYDVYAGGSVTDPQGPGSGSLRVLRGGCWSADAKDCRSALRDNDFPTDSNLIQGFRVLLAPGQP